MNPFYYVRVRYFLILFIVLSILDHVAVLYWEQMLHDSAKLFSSIKALCFYILPALWLCYEYKRHRIPWSFFVNRKERYKPLHVVGITGGLLVFCYGFFVVLLYCSSWFTPHFMESPVVKLSEWAEGLKATNAGVIEFIIVVLLAPVIEELLFRGFLFQRFAVKWGTEKAIFAVAILFGSFHADLVGAFAASIVLSIVYIRTQSLLMTMSIHFLYNVTLFMTFRVFYENGEEVLKSMQGNTMYLTGAISFMIGLNFVLIFWFANRRYIGRGAPSLHIGRAG